MCVYASGMLDVIFSLLLNDLWHHLSCLLSDIPLWHHCDYEVFVGIVAILWPQMVKAT